MPVALFALADSLVGLFDSVVDRVDQEVPQRLAQHVKDLSVELYVISDDLKTDIFP